eukprot:CAMPEP_0178369930 /NCGR_PEP_ID=MMETSP0689_2-20121128/32_1 /TAXON_ID=160604 /ORGANISM="Amphidinium massartii, Strain CS-259" /LENGTH=309 /DNA_ID=CAMNT_0019989719 /DNA_START=285 /DNA_END=1214 /DNA_ORIENTATION=-
MILRFSSKHGLRVLLPPSGNVLNELGSAAATLMPWQNRTMKYDVIALHTKWSHSAAMNILGRKAAYFTILREPIEQWLSWYNYYPIRYHSNKSADEFLLQNRIPTLRELGWNPPEWVSAQNTMLYDLGLPGHALGDAIRIEETITNTFEFFDLVMLMERFDESLVLLNMLLCWGYEQFAYLKLNTRSRSNSSARDALSATAKNRLRAYISGNIALYSLAEKRFDESLHQVGTARVQNELAELHRLNKQVAAACVHGTVPLDTWSPGVQVWAYQINEGGSGPDGLSCKYYGIQEQAFIDEIRTEYSSFAV